MEYSKLGLEHFSPEYAEYFHRLPEATRDEVRAGQDLLYKGISADTSARIYDRLYERTVDRPEPGVTYRAACELRRAEATPTGGVRLHLHHLDEDVAFTHEADVVVLATGYEPAPLPVDPALLERDARRAAPWSPTTTGWRWSTVHPWSRPSPPCSRRTPSCTPTASAPPTSAWAPTATPSYSTPSAGATCCRCGPATSSRPSGRTVRERSLRSPGVLRPRSPSGGSGSNRELLAKLLTEFMFEELLTPERTVRDGTFGFVLSLPTGEALTFTGRRRFLGQWRVDPASLAWTVGGVPMALPDVAEVVAVVAPALGVDPSTTANAVVELSNTLLSDSFQLARGRPSSELADLDPLVVEAEMRGHPWIVANKGRLGFDARELLAHAPESAQPVALPWLAVGDDLADAHAVDGLDNATVVRDQVGDRRGTGCGRAPRPPASTPTGPSTSPSTRGSGGTGSSPSTPATSPAGPSSPSAPGPAGTCPSSRCAPSSTSTAPTGGGSSCRCRS